MDNTKFENSYGAPWMIAVALLDGPCEKEVIGQKLLRSMTRFGITLPDIKHREGHLKERLEHLLDRLVEMEWAVEQGKLYELTERGRLEAEKCRREMRKTRDMIKRLLSPEKVSAVTMAVHFILALLKLPAALLSGSVGLLNDAMDTTVDAVSSFVVCLGIRFKKERIVNIVLVTFMIITGAFTLVQAIKKVFVPEKPDGDILAFAAAVISAVICLILYFYQRYAGIKTSTPALVTQSVDSRNHVIAALGVTAGLIAAAFDFLWLDVAVGIVVALLICKSAFELLVDMVKSSGSDEVDLSSYRFGMYHRIIVNRYMYWLVYLIDTEDMEHRQALICAAQNMLHGEAEDIFETSGIWEGSDNRWLLEKAVENVFEREMVEEGDILRLTDKGRDYLKKTNARREQLKEKRPPIKTLEYTFTAVFGAVAFAFWFLALRYLFSLLGIDPVWNAFNDITVNAGSAAIIPAPALFLAAGLIIFAYGWFNMCSASHEYHMSGMKNSKRPVKLITYGYYGKARHPMYAMMMFMQAGMSIALCSLPAFILCIVFILIHAGNGLYEDKKQLPQFFPEEYDKYKEKVGRMFFSNAEMAVLFLILLLNAAVIMYRH